MTDNTRFPLKPLDALTPEECSAYQAIVANRGKLPRPFQVLLPSPQVAETLERHSAALWSGVLPCGVLESLFLCVATENRCSYQWDTHVAKAIEAGVPAETIAQIRQGQVPSAPGPLADALAFAQQMLRTRRVDAAGFQRAKEAFGERGIAELCAFMGFANTISILLNVQMDPADPDARTD